MLMATAKANNSDITTDRDVKATTSTTTKPPETVRLQADDMTWTDVATWFVMRDMPECADPAVRALLKGSLIKTLATADKIIERLKKGVAKQPDLVVDSGMLELIVDDLLRDGFSYPLGRTFIRKMSEAEVHSWLDHPVGKRELQVAFKGVSGLELDKMTAETAKKLIEERMPAEAVKKLGDLSQLWTVIEDHRRTLRMEWFKAREVKISMGNVNINSGVVDAVMVHVNRDYTSSRLAIDLGALNVDAKTKASIKEVILQMPVPAAVDELYEIKLGPVTINAPHVVLYQVLASTVVACTGAGVNINQKVRAGQGKIEAGKNDDVKHDDNVVYRGVVADADFVKIVLEGLRSQANDRLADHVESIRRMLDPLLAKEFAKLSEAEHERFKVLQEALKETELTVLSTLENLHLKTFPRLCMVVPVDKKDTASRTERFFNFAKKVLSAPEDAIQSLLTDEFELHLPCEFTCNGEQHWHFVSDIVPKSLTKAKEGKTTKVLTVAERVLKVASVIAPLTSLLAGIESKDKIDAAKKFVSDTLKDDTKGLPTVPAMIDLKLAEQLRGMFGAQENPRIVQGLTPTTVRKHGPFGTKSDVLWLCDAHHKLLTEWSRLKDPMSDQQAVTKGLAISNAARGMPSTTGTAPAKK